MYKSSQDKQIKWTADGSLQHTSWLKPNQMTHWNKTLAIKLQEADDTLENPPPHSYSLHINRQFFSINKTIQKHMTSCTKYPHYRIKSMQQKYIFNNKDVEPVKQNADKRFLGLHQKTWINTKMKINSPQAQTKPTTTTTPHQRWPSHNLPKTYQLRNNQILSKSHTIQKSCSSSKTMRHTIKTHLKQSHQNPTARLG